MRAGADACSCPECQTVCQGHFGGCSAVWARGPVEVTLSSSPSSVRVVTEEPVDPFESPAPAQATASPALPGPRMGFGGAEGGRTEILDWMRAAFDGLRRELRVLNDTVARHQSTLGELAESRAAETRVVDLADTLPDRLGAGIAAAIEARQDAYMHQVDEHVSRLATQLAIELPRRLGTAIADAIEERHDVLLRRVEQTTAQLREELVADVADLVMASLRQPSVTAETAPRAPGTPGPSLEQAVTGAVDHVLHRAEGEQSERWGDSRGPRRTRGQVRPLRERREGTGKTA